MRNYRTTAGTLFAAAIALAACAGASRGVTKTSRELSESTAARAPMLAGNRCAECHRLDPMLSHPVGVVPSMPVPMNLPLENGRITCTTCHDDSGGKASHDAAVGGQSKMLRMTVSEQGLCLQCHNPSSSTRGAQHGARATQVHLASSRRSDPRRTAIDPETQNCLTCHDGLMSSNIGGADSHRLFALDNEAADDHPVGVEYPLAVRSRNALIQLVPAAALDRRIRLFDGRIGCNSCHSPFSPEKNLLVMSNEHSRLCLSCHRE